jgi:hypothetical protein
MEWQYWFFNGIRSIDALIYLVCAVISGTRLSRSPAGVFGSIGFGLLFLSSMSSNIFRFMSAQGPGRGVMTVIAMGLQLLGFLGLLCLLAMLLTIKINKKADASQSPTNTNPSG